MELERQIGTDLADPPSGTATSGFLKNNGVDTKHQVQLLARVEPNGPLTVYELAPLLEQDFGVRFSFKNGEKVTDYSFQWRDDAGRVRYSTDMRSAPNGRYFSSIGGWWMTETDAPKAQVFLPSYALA